MCITTLEAELKQTYIGNWDVWHPEFGYRHVLTYQNRPQNLSTSSNCMLLHIQSRSPLTPENILDTSKDLDFLKEMSRGLLPVSRSKDSFDAGNYVTEMGIYHIALLNDLSRKAVADVLSRIPPEKKPDIPTSYLEFYGDVFEGFPLVLCCFNNKESKDASPIMVQYDPIYPEVFMFNTLDGHGSLPEIGKRQMFHQTLITASYQLEEEGNGFEAFNLSEISEHLLPWIPKIGTAERIDFELPNMDLLVDAQIIACGGDAVLRTELLN